MFRKLLGQVGPSPFGKVSNEMSAVEARRDAREVELRDGRDVARQHVKEKYAAKRETLDVETELRAKELEDDPEALADLLERVGGEP